MGRKRPEHRKTQVSTGRHTKITEFEQRWGIHVKDLARVEGVAPQSIIMRVHTFGTPFQRRNKPTAWEQRWGKPLGQLAQERGIHPASLYMRIKKYDSLELPPGTRERPWLRDPSWIEKFEWDFCLKDTYFTLEDALARLAQLKQQDLQNEASKDLGNDHRTTL